MYAKTINAILDTWPHDWQDINICPETHPRSLLQIKNNGWFEAVLPGEGFLGFQR